MVIRADRRNKGSNTRTLIWHTGRAASVDQSACTTFTNDAWPTQEGVALRVSTDGHPGRAITVMKNIYGSATTRFNVQLIDMSLPTEHGRITPPVPGAEFAAVLAGPTQPWRLCARVIGDRLDYKVWLAASSEPAWDDPTASRTMTLPQSWVYPGRPGVYLGHLTAGAGATLTAISYTDLDPAPTPPPTTSKPEEGSTEASPS